MVPTSLSQIASWIGAHTEKEATVTGGQIDSRSVKPGDLFFALPGEKADGHDYIPSAAKNGASAAVVTRAGDYPIPALVVEDVARAMGDLARNYRQGLNCKICAVTGSVGKTTTKEMTWLALSSKYRTGKTQGNYNNQLGLPLTIMTLDQGHQAAVLEMGMNHFGEISHLTSVAMPDVAVISNIGTMHIEHLGSREGILKAKLEILEGLRPGGLAVLNGDEPLLRGAKLNCRVCWFGIDSPDCQIRATELETCEKGSSFTVTINGESQKFTLPVEGRHNVMDALAAIAVGLELGVSLAAMAKSLKEFENTGMRQRSYSVDGISIIEDCYNAGPESTAAALEVLKTREGRRIAVLGSMLELGSHSEKEHRNIGRLTKGRADILLTYGDDMALAAHEAKELGLEARSFQSHGELAAALNLLARPGDTILFKGSRGMAMEKALNAFVDMRRSGNDNDTDIADNGLRSGPHSGEADNPGP